MLIRKCHTRDLHEGPAHGTDGSPSRSEVEAVYPPLSRGSILYLWDLRSAGLAANEVISSVCEVVQARKWAKFQNTILAWFPFRLETGFKRIIRASHRTPDGSPECLQWTSETSGAECLDEKELFNLISIHVNLSLYKCSFPGGVRCVGAGEKEGGEGIGAWWRCM